MYFNKITLRKNVVFLNKITSCINKNGYDYHQLIWNLFSENDPDKERDFIYRSEFNNHWPNFYIISKTQPFDQNDIWEINTKIYQPVIKNNEKFFFMLRVNPRICRKDATGKHKYFDIVQDAFYQAKNNENMRKSKSEIIQDVGIKWLSIRGQDNGFAINTASTIVDNFQKHTFNKLKHTSAISFSTIDFRGQLKVSDSEKFTQTLFQGIGAAKGFGCGLLMVKR